MVGRGDVIINYRILSAKSWYKMVKGSWFFLFFGKGFGGKVVCYVKLPVYAFFTQVTNS